jgi:hypothetical protein
MAGLWRLSTGSPFHLPLRPAVPPLRFGGSGQGKEICVNGGFHSHTVECVNDENGLTKIRCSRRGETTVFIFRPLTRVDRSFMLSTELFGREHNCKFWEENEQ